LQDQPDEVVAPVVYESPSLARRSVDAVGRSIQRGKNLQQQSA